MLNHTFKLEKVLNYKKDIETVRKGVLGDINNKLNLEQEKLIEFYIYKDNLINKKNEMQKKTDIRSLKLYNNQLESICRDIKSQEELISNINLELDHAKAELLEAVKEKKTLQKLKEKEYEEFANEIEKKQEKIIDNIVSFKNMSQQ